MSNTLPHQEASPSGQESLANGGDMNEDQERHDEQLHGDKVDEGEAGGDGDDNDKQHDARMEGEGTSDEGSLDTDRPPPTRIFFQDILDAEAAHENRRPFSMQIEDANGSPIADDVDMVLRNQRAFIEKLLAAFRYKPIALPQFADGRFDDFKILGWWEECRRYEWHVCKRLDSTGWRNWEMTVEKRMWDVLKEVIAIHRNGPISGMTVDEGMSCSARLKAIEEVIADFLIVRADFADVTTRSLNILLLASAPLCYARGRMETFWTKIRNEGEVSFAAMRTDNERMDREMRVRGSEPPDWRNLTQAPFGPFRHLTHPQPINELEEHDLHTPDHQLEEHTNELAELDGGDAQTNDTAVQYSSRNQYGSIDADGDTKIEDAPAQGSAGYQPARTDPEGAEAAINDGPGREPGESPEKVREVMEDVAQVSGEGDGINEGHRTNDAEDPETAANGEEVTEQPKVLTAEEKAQRKARKKERKEKAKKERMEAAAAAAADEEEL